MITQIGVFLVWLYVGYSLSSRELDRTKAVKLNPFFRRHGFRGIDHYRQRPVGFYLLLAFLSLAGIYADSATQHFIRRIQ